MLLEPGAQIARETGHFFPGSDAALVKPVEKLLHAVGWTIPLLELRLQLLHRERFNVRLHRRKLNPKRAKLHSWVEERKLDDRNANPSNTRRLMPASIQTESIHDLPFAPAQVWPIVSKTDWLNRA